MAYLVVTNRNLRPAADNSSLQTVAIVSFIEEKEKLKRNCLDEMGATTILFLIGAILLQPKFMKILNVY